MSKSITEKCRICALPMTINRFSICRSCRNIKCRSCGEAFTQLKTLSPFCQRCRNARASVFRQYGEAV